MFGVSRTPGQQSRGYSGSDSYRYVDKLINDNGCALRIVSPFITPDYANELQRIAKKKRVYVITSRAQSQKQNMAIGILQTRRKLVDFKAILIISIFLYLMFALNQFVYFAAGLVVLAIAILLWLKGPRSNLRLKVVTDKFIHEKLYISDDNAIVGSANLTYAGMHKNIEHIELINEQDKVNQLSEHFDELWSKY